MLGRVCEQELFLFAVPLVGVPEPHLREARKAVSLNESQVLAPEIETLREA